MNDFTLFFMYDMVWVSLLAIIYATYALLSKPKGDKAVRLTIGFAGVFLALVCYKHSHGQGFVSTCTPSFVCLVVCLCPLSQKQAHKTCRIDVGCALLCIFWHCNSVARHVEYVAFYGTNLNKSSILFCIVRLLT